MKTIALTFCSLALLLVAQRLAAADDAGITVTATGESTVKPDRLEIDLKAAAGAELSADAVVKYKDALRRAKEAFDKLKLGNLQVIERGFNVASSGGGNPNANAFVGGQPQQPAKSEVDISKSLRLAVSGIDKMSEEEVATLVAKLLDTAKDAGVVAGSDTNSALMMRMGVSAPNSMVTFVVNDPSAARKKAAEDAVRQAKEKAQRLAELTGSQLGAVLSVEENPVSTGKEKSAQERMMMLVYGLSGAEPDDPRLTSTSLAELPVRVNVRIRFALGPGAGVAAK
jgi:uncharacterized protein YggE